MSKHEKVFNLLDTLIIDLTEKKKALLREVEFGQMTNAQRHEAFNTYYIQKLNDATKLILEQL